MAHELYETNFNLTILDDYFVKGSFDTKKEEQVDCRF